MMLVGCSHFGGSQKIVGKWQWDYTSENGKCTDYGLLSLKSNGTFSESSESGCETIIADDSFGIHRLGWYIAENMVCFSSDKETIENKELTDYCRNYGYTITTNGFGNTVLLKKITFGGVTDNVELSKIK